MKMIGKFLKSMIGAILVSSIVILAGCSGVSNNSKGSDVLPTKVETSPDKVVNLYTDRHYEADQKLFEDFTKEKGIKVNVVSGKSDELLERLVREGKDTQADMFITADAGRLSVAKDKEMLAAVNSTVLSTNIPVNLKDVDSKWFGLTVRARVIVYSKDRVNPKDLSTYEDLTNTKWKGKVLVRPSSNIYNQSLVASFIELKGEEETKKWAEGLVANMAREPKGNDRDQATAIVAGTGDVAIMNTYYLGLMLNSSNQEEVNVANKVGVFFPNQENSGTHVNISGAGVTKYAKNVENAIKLLEYMSEEKAQKQFAEANYEYPANPKVEPSQLLKSWGEFKRQNLNLSKLGENNSRAVKIMNEVKWK
jgi:iron(III) transport system substrate-binding protein